MPRFLALVVAGALLGGACAEGRHEAGPGDVVDDEAFTVAVDHDVVDARRITYGSTGADGEPALVTGVVFVPPGEAPDGGWPVLALGHGTTGGADRCAPSRPSNVEALALRVAPFVRAGYVVAATDYEGLGTRGPHPYLHGRSAGRTMTDVARAARELVADTSTTWFAFGYSQGGHAALFTAEVAPSYAPELDLAGVVAVAPAGDPEALMSNLLVGTSFEALLAAGWLGSDPAVGEEVLTESGKEVVDLVGRRCHVATESPAVVEEEQDAFRAYLGANRPGQDPTEVPMLVVQGGGDQLVTPAMTDELLNRLCAVGADVERIDEQAADHATVFGASVPIAVEWLAGRARGEPVERSC